MRGEQRKNFRIEWNSPAAIYDVDRELLRPCILATSRIRAQELLA